MLRHPSFKYLLLILLWGISQSSFADSSIALIGGSSRFNEIDTHQTGSFYGLSYRHIDSSGIGFSGTVSYVNNEGRNDVSPIRMVPVELSAMMFLFPESRFRPFLAAGLDINFMGSSYQSPGLGFHFKGGFEAILNPRTRLNLGYEWHILDDSKTNLDLNREVIQFGLVFDIEPKPKKAVAAPQPAHVDQLEKPVPPPAYYRIAPPKPHHHHHPHPVYKPWHRR